MQWPTSLQTVEDGYILDFLDTGPVKYVSKGQLGHGQYAKVLKLSPAYGDGPTYAAKVFYDAKNAEVQNEIKTIEAVGMAPDSPMVPTQMYGDIALMEEAVEISVALDQMRGDKRIDWVITIVEQLADGQDQLIKLGYVYTDMKVGNIGLLLDEDNTIVFLDYGGLCSLYSNNCQFNIATLPPPVMASHGKWDMDPDKARGYGYYMVSKAVDDMLLEPTDDCPGLMNMYFNAVDPEPKANHTHCRRKIRRATKSRAKGSPSRRR